MFESRRDEFELNSFVFSKYRLYYCFLAHVAEQEVTYDNFRKDRVSRKCELNRTPTPISHSPYTTGNTFLSPRSAVHVYLAQ